MQTRGEVVPFHLGRRPLARESGHGLLQSPFPLFLRQWGAGHAQHLELIGHMSVQKEVEESGDYLALRQVTRAPEDHDHRRLLPHAANHLPPTYVTALTEVFSVVWSEETRGGRSVCPRAWQPRPWSPRAQRRTTQQQPFACHEQRIGACCGSAVWARQRPLSGEPGSMSGFPLSGLTRPCLRREPRAGRPPQDRATHEGGWIHRRPACRPERSGGSEEPMGAPRWGPHRTRPSCLVHARGHLIARPTDKPEPVVIHK